MSKLRGDANLCYLYIGLQKRRGRPRKSDGKVDLPDLTRFTSVETVQPQVDLYTQHRWHVWLKREIRVAYLIDRRLPNRLRTCLLFSTDVEQDPKQIVQFYQLRFQIEFLFRDAKQFTGLSDWQARDPLKSDFPFNASFTPLNLAKFDAHHQHQSQDPFVFSMASVKRRALNQHLLERFIAVATFARTGTFLWARSARPQKCPKCNGYGYIVNLDLESRVIKSHPNDSTLFAYGAIAA